MGRSQQPLEHRLLLTATFCLLAGGAVMVYSASSARTVLQGQGDGTMYLAKYVGYGFFGLIAMHIISRLRLDLIRRYTSVLLGASFVMLVMVKVPGLGVEVNGATRWLGFGPLQFQPSEIVKLALVLHVAAVIAERPKIARNIRTVVGPVLAVGGGAVLLIAAQPDLGTCLVICFTMAVLLVIAGLPMRQLGLMTGAGAVLVLLFAILEPYRRERLTSFLDPWAHAHDEGFQIVQGQIAIGSGGIFGNGLGQSIQKIFYVPEAHTDFILTIIGEELGLAGIVGLLSLYGIIAYAGLQTAKKAKGIYATLVAAGITSLILCQALLNVYAILGLAPLTGVPLPFISSGSTSLITLMVSMGVLLNVASGGHAHTLSAVPQRSKSARDRAAEDRHRGRRDGGARGAGDSRRRRAAS
ncbi:putative lipid II flippase FtsW [Solirubrobacter sp. CPCC 204708]|uniref:Probable peptidoglycan glycosyltransferase FtsW n=1 Tax=Solirubrobacter deserti TaxID=2282478 RepID=A0ABT4RRI9_9ACTN|nr:putative lipid II flippase FtsW [Solirubrobacter deserti]MBE2314696.1 putative lipid II flippase FtsW [Solirubrobacter deserti]MDA0141013.1 putative lipid II flippase FtsW [Solirubrobacter deserti]